MTYIERQTLEDSRQILSHPVIDRQSVDQTKLLTNGQTDYTQTPKLTESEEEQRTRQAVLFQQTEQFFLLLRILVHLF